MKKEYVKPEITHELELETRAGSLPCIFCPEPTPPCGDVID